jgi:hypothetical protein
MKSLQEKQDKVKSLIKEGTSLDDINPDSEVDSAGSKATESNNTPRSGRMNSAGPFKARTNGFHEKSVAAATHYSPDDPFPALKGWAKFIRPLRGQLRNRG